MQNPHPLHRSSTMMTFPLLALMLSKSRGFLQYFMRNASLLLHALREFGKQKDLYALNIGRLYLLILVIDRAEFSNKLGAVWYYARRTAIDLRNILGDA